MKKGSLSILFIVFMSLVLVSCQGEAPEQAGPVKRAPRPEKKPEPEAKVEEKEEVDVATVKRNPFLNFMVKKGVRKEDERVKGPLECCELNLFKVIAVVSGIDEPRAVIQAPDNKKYIVKIGDRMGTNDGRIIRIGRGSITVREKVRNEFGEVVATNDVELALPREDRKGLAGQGF